MVLKVKVKLYFHWHYDESIVIILWAKSGAHPQVKVPVAMKINPDFGSVFKAFSPSAGRGIPSKEPLKWDTF